jgi:hypothetical protein
MSANGMVRPCSCPASKRSWRGAPKTRSTLCLPTKGSSLVRRLVLARNDQGKKRVRAWLMQLDDAQLSSSLGLTAEDIAVLRAGRGPNSASVITNHGSKPALVSRYLFGPSTSVLCDMA